MKRGAKCIYGIVIAVGLASCGDGIPKNATELTPIQGNEIVRLAFDGAPEGSCDVEAPNSVVSRGKIRNVDVVTITGGIETSTLFCETEEGRVQTNAHRALVSSEVKTLELIGVGVVKPGMNRLVGTSVQTNGTFTVQGNLLWELG